VASHSWRWFAGPVVRELGNWVLAAVILPASASATTYYVNGWTGNNATDGLAASVGNGHGPLRNITAALAVSGAGDTIQVAAGFYQERNWLPAGQNLELPATGTVYVSDTDPDLTDSDHDGMADAWEAAHGLNPWNHADANLPSRLPWAHGLSNLQVDQHPSVLLADNYSTVRDEIPDWWKVKSGLSLLDPSVAAGDADHDGYMDRHEFQSGTDPLDPASHPTNSLPDLAGWWPFNEGTGRQTVSSVGTNLTGRLIGNPLPAWTSGMFSNALAFDGAQNEVVIADDPQLSPTHALSITAWVKTALDMTSEVVAKWSTNAVAGSYLLSLTNGQVRLELMLHGSYTALVGPAASLSDTNWHHIAGSYDGTTMQVFLDGTSVGSQAASGTVDVVAAPLRLGLLAGQLDDIRLYNLALSPADIAGLADADSDEDGIPNYLEVNMAANQDPDGDGFTNLEEYRQGTDPHDYYNGVLPVLTVINGTGQVGFTNQVLRQPLVWVVTAGNGVTLSNAPVTVTAGAGLLSVSSNGLFTATVTLRTGADGKSTVWLRLPDHWGTTNPITLLARSGLQTVQVGMTTRTYALTEDSDRDGLPDWWMLEHFGHRTGQVGDRSRASDDADGDGYSNLQEYNGGTDPTHPASVPTNVPPSLAGWWRFDEGRGTNVVDSSGNANTGVLAGEPPGEPLPAWTSGLSSNALQFDGMQNDVRVADAVILAPTNTLTLVAWVRAAANVTGVVISKWTADKSVGSYRLSLTNGQVMLELNLSGTSTALVGQASSVADPNWHLVAGTYDGTNMQVYFDGASVGSQAASGTVDVGAAPVRLGQLTATLDEVRIYGRSLAIAELNAIYNDSTLGDGIPDWWKLKSGLSLTDPAVASAVSSDLRAHGLTNLQVYQHPSVLIADNNSTVNDGIPDWWKVAHGFSLPDPSVAGADADRDGFTNLEEYWAGTDPRNASSKPAAHPSAALMIPNAWAIYASSNTVQVTANIRSTNRYVTVQAAEVFLDSPGPTGHGLALSAVDGRFDSTNETGTATFTPTFPSGHRHELFVHAQGKDKQWCAYKKIIINPTVTDILDKVAANYSRIADVSYNVTVAQYLDGKLQDSGAFHVQQKGGYLLRQTDPTTGLITVMSANRTGYLDGQGQYQGGFEMETIANMMTGVTATNGAPYYWDLPGFYIKFQGVTNSSISITTNGVATFHAVPSNANAVSEVNITVDYGRGIPAREDYRSRDGVVRRIDHDASLLIPGDIWLPTNERVTTTYPNGRVMECRTAISNVKVNQGLADSLFAIPNPPSR